MIKITAADYSFVITGTFERAYWIILVLCILQHLVRAFGVYLA